MRPGIVASGAGGFVAGFGEGKPLVADVGDDLQRPPGASV
jgi:hypothetical protein